MTSKNLKNEDSELLTPNTTGDTIASLVESKLGCPYEWGAAGPDSFDCSGLTYWAHQQVGISIPRTEQAQAQEGEEVSIDDLQPGDLLFYDCVGEGNISHVTTFVGGTSMIHAPQEGEFVKYADMTSGYWTERFITARRLW